MFRLEVNDYCKVIHLVKSQNELSVYSVIKGIMPGEVYVNNIDNPTAVLIKTSECNLIAGSSDDTVLIKEIATELEFWDQLTPDSEEWIDLIPAIHKNPFVRRYKRRRYTLSSENFMEYASPLTDGFVLEKVDIEALRKSCYENSEKVLEWASNWGDDAAFQKYGTGYYIRNDQVIASWSLSDCCADSKVAIGIHTDERFRKHGFGKKVVSATAKECFAKGYETIDWLCVDTNKGSIAIAEKLGFRYSNHYDSFSSYPPIENIKDLTEPEWHEWGDYLQNASETADCLIWDALYCYIKANDSQRTIQLMARMEQRGMLPDYEGIKNYISYLQEQDLCSDFRSQTWIDFLNTKVPY